MSVKSYGSFGSMDWTVHLRLYFETKIIVVDPIFFNETDISEQNTMLLNLVIHSPGLTFDNFPDELPRFARVALYAESVRASNRFRLLIHTDEGDWVDGGEENRCEAHAAGLAIDVQNIGVSFGGAVELSDEVDAEAVGKLLPDARPQSVAPHYLHAVAAILRGLRHGK